MRRGTIKMTRYQTFLMLAFAGVWTWAAIHPKYPHDWLLENYLVFIFVPIILLISCYFRLSNISYTLITVFMSLHVIGSHYTYAEVPFGYDLQQWLGANRNMYDRLVHFSFGLLLAYPMREVFQRIAKAQGVWSFWLPIELVLAFSAGYEIIEWLVAAQVDPTAGLAFLGTQGDIWDAQKDMLLAGAGATLSMGLVALLHWRYNPGFMRELRESLSIKGAEVPLGEVKLRELLRRMRQKP
jgi:putative membrane protein